MHSAIGTTSSSPFLHRSPSGAQRRIRQRLGGEWPPQQRATPATVESPEPRVVETMSPPNGAEEKGSLGYRSLVASADYRSVLPNDDLESKFGEWRLPQTPLFTTLLGDSAIKPQKPPKPTPMPRSPDPHSPSPQRQRHHSGSANSAVSVFDVDERTPPKPMLQVHPFAERIRPLQPPPVPTKPKSLQRPQILDRTISSAEAEPASVFGMDVESLEHLERQRIASLTSLYQKVNGRLDDLKNLHNERKRTAEIFGRTMDIAQRHGLLRPPFDRFVRRFETVYEVQTLLTLNKEHLQRELERTADMEFLGPLIEKNEWNLRDVERIVDELDHTFRELDAQLCEVLQPEEHEHWVFFVRSLYSLIAEQSAIQQKVNQVTDQIKKLENFSFEQIIQSRAASVRSAPEDIKEFLNSSSASSLSSEIK